PINTTTATAMPAASGSLDFDLGSPAPRFIPTNARIGKPLGVVGPARRSSPPAFPASAGSAVFGTEVLETTVASVITGVLPGPRCLDGCLTDVCGTVSAVAAGSDAASFFAGSVFLPSAGCAFAAAGAAAGAVI